jgi:hypothetical protein
MPTAAKSPFPQQTNTSTTVPAIDLVAITPSDTDDLARVVRDIRVGGDGNVTVVTTSGAEIAFLGCLAGERLGPFFVARVKSTGTTATGLVGYV